MKEMQFTIQIKATKEMVWNTLWQDETFRQWASVIDPGTYMVGDLKEGNEVQFISSENGYGVTSLVEKLVECEYLRLRHNADTKEKGSQERDKQWTGGAEIYTIADTGDATTLTVTFDVPPEMEEYFAVNYPKALEKIKILAESQK